MVYRSLAKIEAQKRMFFVFGNFDSVVSYRGSVELQTSNESVNADCVLSHLYVDIESLKRKPLVSSPNGILLFTLRRGP